MLLAVQPKPHTSTMSVEAMHQRLKDILAREEPAMTQAEEIQKFKDGLNRMRTNWELRHGNT